MIKLVVVAQPRPGMDRIEAGRYWTEVHADFTAKVPGVRRYTLNLCGEGLAMEGVGTGEPPFLGIAEVWFENREDADQALASPEMATALADAANCLDMEHLAVGWCEEHVIV